MSRLLFAVVVLSISVWTAPAFAEKSPGERALGVVTGIKGTVTAANGTASHPRPLRGGDVLQPGDEVRGTVSSRIEVLWHSRAVFSLHGESGLRWLEPVGGQMLVQLLTGQARIAYSYNEGRPSDTMALILPDARVIMRGGILEISTTSSGEIIRIVEGQSSIELVSVPAKSVLLKAGQEIELRAGSADVPHPSTATMQPSLVAMEHHRAVPPSTVQQLAQTHVAHALELEERLRRATKDPHDDTTPHDEATNVILSTSLGLPVTSLSGATSTPLVSATPPVTPGSLIAPPLQTPTVTTPPTPSVVTLGPVQAGGINTSDLLQNTLKSILKK